VNKINISIEVNPEHRDEFLQTIKSINEDSRSAKGFKQATLYQDMNDADHFSLIHEFETQDDMEIHLRSEDFRVLLGALKLLGNKSKIEYTFTSFKQDDMVRVDDVRYGKN
jgi:quinol monooxygenase YgiN